MIANNLMPSEPIHPGEILKDEIDYRGISQKSLAEETGISYTVINEVLNCKRQLTSEYALLIAAALDLDAEPLLQMQTDYNCETLFRSNTFLSRLKQIRKIAASVVL